MKYLFHIIVCLVIAMAGQCFGTSTPPLPLSWLVANSQLIFLGVATNLDVTTQGGSNVSSSEAQIAWTDTCRLTVQVVEVVKSGTKMTPQSVSISYSNQWIRTVGDERKEFLGKKMIYFLRGKDYGPVDTFQFVAPMEQVDEVKDLVGKKP